jgi:hypothetical protein
MVVALALLPASAQGAGANLLSNGTFEGSGSGSLSGWKGRSATLSLVSGDGGGFAAGVARTANVAYAIVTSSKPVKSTTAGRTYVADGRFNAPSGKTVCLKLKEAGAAPASAMSCAGGTGGWATLPELSYTAGASGDSLLFLVLQQRGQAGDAFRVDNLSVAVASAAIDPPTNLNATPSRRARSTCPGRGAPPRASPATTSSGTAAPLP